MSLLDHVSNPDIVSLSSPDPGQSVGASAASQTPTPMDSMQTDTKANGTRASSPKFSASTEDILRRLSANAVGRGSPAGFEAVKEDLLKGLRTSDKIPLPPPSLPRRGRPPGRGRLGNGSRSGSLAGASGTPGELSRPDLAMRGRGRGMGRGRGRGRGGGRGGKRKREDSDVESELTKTEGESDDMTGPDEDDDEGENDNENTPLPTRTKSGRSVNKPTQFVPAVQSPASSHKKRKPYRRNPESALCKTCHRGVSPNNNQIVFCDGCGGAYHQYCHDPPIDRETVLITEKEWFCASCVRRRTREVAGKALDGLVSGEKMSEQEKRAYLYTLPHPRLVDLILYASNLHPSLPLFSKFVKATDPSATPPTSMPAGAAGTHGAPVPTSTDADAEHDVDDDDVRSHPYDGYDTDPPAHYPKPGNGLARTLRPDADDLEFLVDSNTDVFSHEFEYPIGDEHVPAAGAGAENGHGAVPATGDLRMGGI